MPVLFLSARTDEETVVRGIEQGGDDYIRKPFGISELKARIQKVLRGNAASGNILRAGPLMVDVDKRMVTLQGRTLPLGKREFDILAALAKKAGDVITRDSILAGFEERPDLYDRTIDSHMSHLRRKMREVAGESVQITSVYGVGYRLDWTR